MTFIYSMPLYFSPQIIYKYSEQCFILPFFLFHRATSPSVDSGNPSECSPLKAEPEIEDEELIDEVEHTENFENDIYNITQKINILSSKGNNIVLKFNSFLLSFDRIYEKS